MPEPVPPLSLVLVALPPLHDAAAVGLLGLEPALVVHPLELVVAGVLKDALALGLAVGIDLRYVISFINEKD